MKRLARTARAVAAPASGLSFEIWAELSARVLELPEEAFVRALFARGLSLAVWQQLDRKYRGALSDDLHELRDVGGGDSSRQQPPGLSALRDASFDFFRAHGRLEVRLLFRRQLLTQGEYKRARTGHKRTPP